MKKTEAYYKRLLWFLTCSNCGYSMSDKDDEGDPIATNYCPNCGAKILGFRREAKQNGKF